jgi:SAM-dependent methyltransferase
MGGGTLMHPAAHEGFRRQLEASWLIPERVLDLGGQSVNGVPYGFLPPTAVIDVIDIDPDVRVDPDPRIASVIIADACTWRPGPDEPGRDLVMSTELLEHVQDWRLIVETARRAVVPGGWFIGTCAGPGRRPHGATGAPDLSPGEHYANIDPSDLAGELHRWFSHAVVECVRDEVTHDLYWRAKA